jgi:hypothetical protein
MPKIPKAHYLKLKHVAGRQEVIGAGSDWYEQQNKCEQETPTEPK